MKSFNHDTTNLRNGRSWPCIILQATFLLFLLFYLATAFVFPDQDQNFSRWAAVSSFENLKFGGCKSKCRPPGSESLPEGIVSKTSNLQMRPLWGKIKKSKGTSANSLFAMPVGIKQRDLVNKMVKKFLSSNFTVMLFHYDGNVDEWKDFEWSDSVVHVSARNQTKWWFAKRFLHPDIVAEYDYIFLWDEDLGVQNFDPQRYLSIVQSEVLEISQPALHPGESEIHSQITSRLRKSIVHRRTYKPGVCDGDSTAPPCTGWVEMMAPVFSRSVWRCVWYMIQNDLIHAWGLDYQLGYCVQGDRTKRIGIVDSEYIVHYGRPTLGGGDKQTDSEVIDPAPVSKVTTKDQAKTVHKLDPRVEVRRQSFRELKVFQKRWAKAAETDKCWIDPYKQAVKKLS